MRLLTTWPSRAPAPKGLAGTGRACDIGACADRDNADVALAFSRPLQRVGVVVPAVGQDHDVAVTRQVDRRRPWLSDLEQRLRLCGWRRRSPMPPRGDTGAQVVDREPCERKVCGERALPQPPNRRRRPPTLALPLRLHPARRVWCSSRRRTGGRSPASSETHRRGTPRRVGQHRLGLKGWLRRRAQPSRQRRTPRQHRPDQRPVHARVEAGAGPGVSAAEEPLAARPAAERPPALAARASCTRNPPQLGGSKPHAVLLSHRPDRTPRGRPATRRRGAAAGTPPAIGGTRQLRTVVFSG